MDDRRFDSLVKALAVGKSRRSVLKGILGIGAASIGGTLAEGQVDAARRPTPTPTPIRCPGNQTPVNGVCTCPSSAPSKCGPDCCNPAGVGAAHSECCDNACCFGICYGEELCCPTGRTFCEATGECCPADQPYCCGASGCCATPCCETGDGSTCCEGGTPKCCPEDICIPAGGCCDVADCGTGNCWSCVDHVCVSDQSKCPGCLDCNQGNCAINDANCDDGFPCNTNICNGDGTCALPIVDCRNEGCACFPSDACYVASCNQETGQCQQVESCSAECCEAINPDGGCLSNGRCAPGTGPEFWIQIGACYYDLFCATPCCATFIQSDSYCSTEGEFAGQCVVPF